MPELLVERFAFHRAVITDFHHCVDEPFQIDHARGRRQSAPVIDLLIDIDSRRGVVDVNVDDVVVRQFEQFIYRPVRSVPVPAIQQEPHVARADCLDQLHHLDMCADKGETAS